MTLDLGRLDSRQRELLDAWLPGAVVVQNHGWGLVGTTVLELHGADGSTYIAKAGDTDDRNIARELTAHRQWLSVWTSQGRAPKLVAADEGAKLLVTEYLPGRLVDKTADERSIDTYRQAGELLADFHGQYAVRDDGEFERRQKQETLEWLARPHRITNDARATLTEHVRQWPAPPSVLVPTHGDWSPRNWLVADGQIGVIDFGRFDLRPAYTDLGRLAARQFRTDPRLESAFFEGYGKDPREPEAWNRLRIREAVGTAAWAYKVGDEAYEQQGHQMIADILGDLDQP